MGAAAQSCIGAGLMGAIYEHPFEHPWERNGIRTPGLPILPIGVERHPIPGGGSRVVELFAGDEISLLDKEGLQQGELVFFAPNRRSDAAMLGRQGHGRPEATIATLANGTPSGQKVLGALKTAGFALEEGEAIPVLGNGSRAGDFEQMTCSCDGLLIATATTRWPRRTRWRTR